jgi:hypothetical protein
MEGYCTKDLGCKQNIYGTYAYDGIWSLALALNTSLYDEDGPKGYEESAERTAARLLGLSNYQSFQEYRLHGKERF